MKEKFVDCKDGTAEYLCELTEGTSKQRRHGNEISDVNWNDKNLKLQCSIWVKLKRFSKNSTNNVRAVNSAGNEG